MATKYFEAWAVQMKDKPGCVAARKGWYTFVGRYWRYKEWHGPPPHFAGCESLLFKTRAEAKKFCSDQKSNEYTYFKPVRVQVRITAK